MSDRLISTVAQPKDDEKKNECYGNCFRYKTFWKWLCYRIYFDIPNILQLCLKCQLYANCYILITFTDRWTSNPCSTTHFHFFICPQIKHSKQKKFPSPVTWSYHFTYHKLPSLHTAWLLVSSVGPARLSTSN